MDYTLCKFLHAWMGSWVGSQFQALKVPLSSKEGRDAKAIKSSHVGPSEGCFVDSLEAKSRARHRLVSGAIQVPVLGVRRQASWLTALDRQENLSLLACLSVFVLLLTDTYKRGCKE